MAKQESAADICRRRTLQVRIRAMARRWEYAEDEYKEALELAKAGLDAWERLCDQDEAKYGVKADALTATEIAARHSPIIANYGDRPVPETGKAWWNRDSEPTT